MKSKVLTNKFGIKSLAADVTSALDKLDKEGYTIVTVSHITLTTGSAIKYNAIIYYKKK